LGWSIPNAREIDANKSFALSTNAVNRPGDGSVEGRAEAQCNRAYERKTVQIEFLSVVTMGAVPREPFPRQAMRQGR
jgi:hypothetical protein